MDVLVDSLDTRKSIAPQSRYTIASEEATPDFVFGMNMINSEIFNGVGKGFVEPKVVPPLHRDEVAKPLMRQLVRNSSSDGLLSIGGGVRLGEHADFAVRN